MFTTLTAENFAHSCVRCCSASTATCAVRRCPWGHGRPGRAAGDHPRAPGIGVRALAPLEGMSTPAMSGYVDRLEAPASCAGPLAEDRRRVGLELTAEGRALRPPGAHAHRLAGARGCAARPTTSSRRSRPRWSRSRCSSTRERRDDGAPPRQPPHIRQPSQAPQLPALLRRPGRLRQRHLDAEHRHRLARARADALAGGGRRPGALPVPAVHRVRALRRRAGRPHGRAQAR